MAALPPMRPIPSSPGGQLDPRDVIGRDTRTTGEALAHWLDAAGRPGEGV